MYVARPGSEPRTPDLRVRCPTDCATLPGRLCHNDWYPNSHLTNFPFMALWMLDVLYLSGYKTGFWSSGMTSND